MIDMDGMDDETLEAFLDHLAMQQRHVAFSGSKVITEQGVLGTIVTPLRFGPVVRGREVATVGAAYAIPGENQGNDCCPHFANGTLQEGAPDVTFQGRAVVFMGHRGRHGPSCKNTRAVGVVADGWKAAYWSGRSFTF